MLSEHLPIADPARFRISRVVPQSGAITSLQGMPIEDDAEANLAALVDDLVQNLKRRQTLKIRVYIEVDAVGHAGWIQHLSTEGQAKSVVSEALNLVEHVFPITYPETVWTESIGVHAEPVDAGNPDRLSV